MMLLFNRIVTLLLFLSPQTEALEEFIERFLPLLSRIMSKSPALGVTIIGLLVFLLLKILVKIINRHKAHAELVKSKSNSTVFLRLDYDKITTWRKLISLGELEHVVSDLKSTLKGESLLDRKFKGVYNDIIQLSNRYSALKIRKFEENTTELDLIEENKISHAVILIIDKIEEFIT